MPPPLFFFYFSFLLLFSLFLFFIWGPQHKPSRRLFVMGRAEAIVRFMALSAIC